MKVGSILENKYEILREIGRGGMSVVYLAMDVRLNKQWAIKEIRKRYNTEKDRVCMNSLIAEADLMKRLDHPALPRIVDIIENSTTIYIIEDYIEGVSLDQHLKEYGPQPEEKVLDWAKQLCDVLTYLHSRKPPIIYRDMKPGNVMLKPEGNIKIIDFGIAREYKDQNRSDTTILGTEGYAPPEQYQGQTDPRSDIYALGMTLHHLLTGRDPRESDGYVPVRQLNPEVSEGLEMIIDRCVEPAAENRYQNCAELLYDLEHPDLITKGYKRMQKRRVRLFAAAVILSAAALVAGFACRGYGSRVSSRNYESLLAQVDSLDAYKDAIQLDIGNPEAYIKILEYYEEQGQFGEDESTEIAGLYNTAVHSSAFDETSAGYAELNYKMGTMYFNYYTTGDDGSYSMNNRVKKAYTYFKLNYENEEISSDFEERELSECYYEICDFYHTFVLSSSSVHEASQSDYEELLATMEETMDTIGDLSTADAYDKLVYYDSVFVVLHDQAASLAENVDSAQVLDLFDTAYENAQALTVKKEVSQTLQQEMSEYYEPWRTAIEAEYQNVAKEALNETEGSN